MAEPTINLTVDQAWSLAVPAAASWCLVSSDSPTIVEYAVGADDSTDPTVAIGRRLKENEGLTRAHIPDGAIYARVANQSSTKKAIIVIDADVMPS